MIEKYFIFLAHMPNGYNFPTNEIPSTAPDQDIDLLAPLNTEVAAAEMPSPPVATIENSPQNTNQETLIPEAGAFIEFKNAAMEAMTKHAENLESISTRERLLAEEQEETQQKFEQRRLDLISEIENVIKPGQEQLNQLADQMKAMLDKFPKTKPGQPQYVQLSFLEVEVQATGDMLAIGRADVAVKIEDVEKRLDGDILEKKPSVKVNNRASFEDFKNKQQNATSQDKLGWQDLKAA
jgi:hypothetical protein